MIADQGGGMIIQSSVAVLENVSFYENFGGQQGTHLRATRARAQRVAG